MNKPSLFAMYQAALLWDVLRAQHGHQAATRLVDQRVGAMPAFLRTCTLTISGQILHCGTRLL